MSVTLNEHNRLYGIVLVIAVISLFISFAIWHAATTVMGRIDQMGSPDMSGPIGFFQWLYAQVLGLVASGVP
jgi:hypothetical protein